MQRLPLDIKRFISLTHLVSNKNKFQQSIDAIFEYIFLKKWVFIWFILRIAVRGEFIQNKRCDQFGYYSLGKNINASVIQISRGFFVCRLSSQGTWKCYLCIFVLQSPDVGQKIELPGLCYLQGTQKSWKSFLMKYYSAWDSSMRLYARIHLSAWIRLYRWILQSDLFHLHALFQLHALFHLYAWNHMHTRILPYVWILLFL